MSYSPLGNDGHALRPVFAASIEDRTTYIGKVYALMLSGLVVFFAMAGGIPVAAVAGQEWAREIVNLMFMVPWWASLLLFLGIQIGASMVSMVRFVNVFAFFGAAAGLGLLTIPLVAMAAGRDGFGVVLQSGLVTTLAFGLVTSVVFVTKKDFSFMRGFLIAGTIMAMLGVAGFAIAALAGAGTIFGMSFSAVSVAISLFVGILTIGYILYDTSNVLHHYAVDMVVPGALALLTDFIILFRTILSLFMSRD